MAKNVRPLRPLIVEVVYFDGVYTASCDELFLTTEADTLDELRARVWEVAPDIIEFNKLPYDPETMELLFKIPPPAHTRAAM